MKLSVTVTLCTQHNAITPSAKVQGIAAHTKDQLTIYLRMQSPVMSWVAQFIPTIIE